VPVACQLPLHAAKVLFVFNINLEELPIKPLKVTPSMEFSNIFQFDLPISKKRIGLRTYESCCGHGKSSFKIWVKGLRHRNILILLRTMDIRYGCPLNWKAYAYMADMPYEDPESLLISSGELVGNTAYSQSLEIAENLTYYINHEAFLKIFSVRKSH